MENEECNDWRVYAKVTLGKDIPPTYIGGKGHKAGTPIYLLHFVKSKEFRYLSFITPNLTALSLNIAVRSSTEANKIKSQLIYEDCDGVKGKYKNVSKQTTSLLYDFFESYMVSVTYSFQALEIFCNSLISRDSNIKYYSDIKNQTALKWGYEIERDLSTEDKISIILPQIKKVAIPKNDPLWQEFIDLKYFRDSIVHLKSPDIFSKIENADKDFLFFRIFKNDPLRFPKTAINVIKYFETIEGNPPWVDHLFPTLNC